ESEASSARPNESTQSAARFESDGWHDSPRGMLLWEEPAMTNVEGYRFGHLTVDGEEHTRDLIVLPDRVVANWWRKDGHALVLDDLEDILDELPESLVVGTGADQRMRPGPGLLESLERRGVEVHVLPTDEAVRRYAELDP